VKAAKTDESDKVVAQLEGHKFNDFFAHNGLIRKEDHRTILDVYQVQVEAEGRGQGGRATTTRDQQDAGRAGLTPLSESKCKDGAVTLLFIQVFMGW